MEVARYCKDCPAETQSVCHYVFGRFWRDDKAHGGTGCKHPVDSMAESWAAGEWQKPAASPPEAPSRTPLPGRPVKQLEFTGLLEQYRKGIGK